MKILNKLLIGLAFCFFFHPVMTKAQTVVSFDGTNLCYNDNSGGIKCVNVTGVPITTVSGLSAYNSRPAGSLVTVTDGASSTDCSTGGGSDKVLCQFQGGTTWSAVAQSGVSGVSSFNGRSGAVSPSSGDYSVAQVTGAAPAASPTFSGTIVAALGTNFDFSNITLVNFPTLNQNTTGSAAKWTTARLLAGNSVDGSANVLFANKFIVQGTSDSGLSGAQFLGSLGTGIIKNTTTTGVLSIAAAGDFPTLNQNTTGTAGGLTGCSPSTAGSLCYWNGSAWTLLVGNTTQTNWLQETSAGVPSWTTPSGSGTVTASPQFEIPDYSAPGTASTITGLSWLTGRDGVPQTLTETTAAGSPTAPVAAVSGIVPNAQTGTTYTIAVTDRNEWVTFSNAASIAVTLPQAGSTGFDANFIVHACDIGAGTATITPTTSTISYTNGSAYTSGATSLALTTGQCATILDDATGTNYTGSVYAGGSSGLSGMTAGQVPIAATANTITSSKGLAGTGTGITTGPTSTTLNDCVKFGDTAGTLADAGAACGSGGGYTPGAATLDSTSIGQPAGNGNWTYLAGNGMTLSGTAPASASTNGTNATAPFALNGVTGGATTGSATTAGTGSSPSITAGNGGSAAGGTNAIGGAGGSITDIAGNGGASGGTAANANGGSIFKVLGSPGTGGSGAAGSYGQFYVLAPNAASVSTLTVCLDNGTHTGCNGTPWLQMTGNHGLTSIQNIKSNQTGIPTELNNGYFDSQGEIATPGATGGMATWDSSTTHAMMAFDHNSTNAGIVSHTLGAVAQTAQTAAIATSIACASAAGACDQAGQYTVDYDFYGSGTACSSVTAGSVQLQLTWTDGNGTTHTVVALPVYDLKGGTLTNQFNFNTSLATEGASGHFNITTNGTVIQYATSYTACTTGTGTYNLHISVSRKQ